MKRAEVLSARTQGLITKFYIHVVKRNWFFGLRRENELHTYYLLTICYRFISVLFSFFALSKFYSRPLFCVYTRAYGKVQFLIPYTRHKSQCVYCPSPPTIATSHPGYAIHSNTNTLYNDQHNNICIILYNICKNFTYIVDKYFPE